MGSIKPIDLSMPRDDSPTIVTEKRPKRWTILDLSIKNHPIRNPFSAQSSNNRPLFARKSFQAPNKRAAKIPKIEPIDPENIKKEQTTDEQQPQQQRKSHSRRICRVRLPITLKMKILRECICGLKSGAPLASTLTSVGAKYGKTRETIRSMIRYINREPETLDQLLKSDEEENDYFEYFGHIK